MFFNRLLGFVIITLTASAFAAPFQNGSFEFNSGNASFSATAWSSTAGTIQYHNAQGTTDGAFAAIFNRAAVSNGDVLSQTFDTTPGLLYAVAFDWGNFQASGTQRLQIGVRDATSNNQLMTFGSGTANVGGGGSGVTIEENTTTFIISDFTGASATNTPAPNAEFSNFGFTFTAQSTSSIISFTDQATGPIASSDGVLDNVRIVPEPNSVALLSVGISSLAFRRRRTSNK